ncbi:hypothetical protein GIB67_008529 [Kingdonia uniflora]|uniref:Pentatricopeptide repeat-containing protein n=1 Tax=Kingdonia uniflora TaxID=39325 RepID=A0A7J7LFK1_9MAGN|nr:hypothetical protein GIB67_008529 [Kingdonia uniflora]
MEHNKGLCKNELEHEAMMHFIFMLRTCDRPNEVTITTIVTACQSTREIKQVHALLISLGFESENSIVNSLVTMYSKSGDVTDAWVAFENLKTKDVVSCFGAGSKPDDITFVGVISACSHAGLLEKGHVKEAKRVVSQMPQDEHDRAILGELLGVCKLHGSVEMANQIG